MNQEDLNKLLSEQVHMQKSHWKNLSNLTIYV